MKPKREMNSKMHQMLEALKGRKFELTDELAAYLKAGVVERNGSVLLEELKDSAGGDFEPDAHFDRTGYECFVNHIHIDPDPPGSTSSLGLALQYAELLCCLLGSSTVPGPFRVIVSADAETYECTVRFHRIRPGEDSLSEDLEGYREEGILAIDC